MDVNRGPVSVLRFAPRHEIIVDFSMNLRGRTIFRIERRQFSSERANFILHSFIGHLEPPKSDLGGGVVHVARVSRSLKPAFEANYPRIEYPGATQRLQTSPALDIVTSFVHQLMLEKRVQKCLHENFRL